MRNTQTSHSKQNKRNFEDHKILKNPPDESIVELSIRRETIRLLYLIGRTKRV